VTRTRPDCTRNSTSRRLNSCLLIDNTATAHLPGPQNPGVCHLYLAQGCHLYIALTVESRERALLENITSLRLLVVKLVVVFLPPAYHTSVVGKLKFLLSARVEGAKRGCNHFKVLVAVNNLY
jgi:hypothetical protein